MDESAAEEKSLMRRLAQDDAEAFDCLFGRHRRTIFGFLLRMADGDAASAEDMTQETFLRLWRTRHSYQLGGAALRTFLLTIARNLARDQYKQSRRTAPTEPLPQDDDALSPTAQARLSAGDPERRLLAQEMTQTLEAAIAALPSDLRETDIAFSYRTTAL